MAYEPLIRDSDGSGGVSFRVASTTEENYLAYQLSLYLADSAYIPNALVTTNSANGTNIGSHSNTYYNAYLGQHGFEITDITTETVSLYQKNSILDETDSDCRRPINHLIDDSQNKMLEFDSDDMDGLTNRLLSRVFTSDYPGTIKLATSAPSGDYTLVQEAFRDTRAGGDSDVNTYNLYKRTSMTAPDAIDPFHIKRSSGATGDYQGLQVLTDRQIKHTFGARARHLISPSSSSIGSYQFRTSVQGAPTDPGTWVAKGTATDTRNTAVETDYTRTTQVTRFTNYAGDYVGNYIGLFTRTLTYTGDFTRDFTGNFLRDFLSPFDYVGNFVTTIFTGNFTEEYVGNFLESFVGDFTRDFIGDFVREFTGNFTGDFTGDFASAQYGPEEYSNNITGTGDGRGAVLWRVFPSTNVSTVTYEDVQVASGTASDTVLTGSDGFQYRRVNYKESTTILGGPGTGVDYYSLQRLNDGVNYQRTSTRAAAETYTGNFTIEYQRNFLGTKEGVADNYDYVGDFIASEYTRNFVGNYVGTFVSDYIGAFLNNFQSNYTTNSTVIFTTTFTDASSFTTSYDSGTNYTADFIAADYTGSYTGNFEGNYASFATYQSDFTTDFLDNYTANSLRNVDEETEILENYVGNFAGDFIGDFTGNYLGYELTDTTATINTYTLYVRVA